VNPATRLAAAEIIATGLVRDHEAAHCSAALLLGLDVRGVNAPPVSLTEHADLTDPTGVAGEVLIARTDDPDYAQRLAITTLAGPLENKSVDWPPAWPLTLVPANGDEAALVSLVGQLGLDRKGYSELVQDAYELFQRPEFERLAVAIRHALDQHGTLDQHTLKRIKAIAIGAHVEHATKAATAVATDQGEFTAIAAAYTVDRQRDQIIRGAFTRTIERWRTSGKRIPLHWNHRGEAANIIGFIDPATMTETAEGLQVTGKLDIDSSDTAREAWRSMKNNSMSLSFGYVTTKARKRSDGVNELVELDLFEISIVPAPANRDTRVVSMKNMDHADSLERVRNEWRDIVTRAMEHDSSAETLREKSERLSREHAPIQIASFEC
jgi:HK97 family phage prohead protease